MPLVEIRPANSKDIDFLSKIEHGSESLYVWQMDNSIDRGQIDVKFREVRLPRALRLEYPRKPEMLATTWMKHDLFLIAKMQEKIVGYLSLDIAAEMKTGRVTNLVVDEPSRRKGVATALLVSAQDWLRIKGISRIMLEIQTRNYNALSFAQKMRYEFCGFMDCYFNNRDIAVFFCAVLK